MKIQLAGVRLAFPDLFEAKPFEAGGPKRYSATFLIEPGTENDKKIRAAIAEVAKEKFGKKADANLKAWEGNSNKHCYIDGAKKEYDGYEGMWALSTHRREIDGRVTVIDRNKQPLSPADGKPYGGCYVNASVDIWGQEGQYPGMRCGLLGVQFVKDGDAFSGAAPASPDEFEDLGVPDEEEALV